MIYSLIGYYSLIIGLIIGLSLFYFSYKNFNNSNTLDTKILSFTFLQLFFVVISFLCLIFSFVISDFSNETVFNNSHTTKPLFYKISGTWGNHEGSLLLWLLVLTLFIFLFLVRTKNQPVKYKILTLVFQQIIIVGFFLFLIKTSNPFNYIFPIPTEGLGLNPILQDPALAIHPPVSLRRGRRECRDAQRMAEPSGCDKLLSRRDVASARACGDVTSCLSPRWGA